MSQATKYYHIQPPAASGAELTICPTLEGLLWILRRHYSMEARTPGAFAELMRQFLLLHDLMFVDKVEKAQQGLLTASPVILFDGDYYLLAGENGLSAIQLLGRDWFLKCNCIKQKDETYA